MNKSEKIKKKILEKKQYMQMNAVKKESLI